MIFHKSYEAEIREKLRNIQEVRGGEFHQDQKHVSQSLTIRFLASQLPYLRYYCPIAKSLETFKKH